MRIKFDEGPPMLCRVVLELHGVNDTQEVEAIFRVQRPEDFSAFLPGKCPYVFRGPLSVTRTDTREAIQLNEEQMGEVTEQMVNAAAEYFAKDDYIGMD